MKIAITVTAASTESPLEPRFGRTPFFAVFDTDGIEDVQFIENVATQEAHGAGVMAAQILIDNDVEAIVCAKYGPNGSQALQQSGIACYLFGDETNIAEIVESFKNDSLAKFTA